MKFDATNCMPANDSPATSATRHSARSAFGPPITSNSTNGTSNAKIGVCRPTIAPSSDSGRPVVVERAVSGSASVPNATGTESAIRAATAAFTGWKPMPTSIAAQIATGAPAPISPSSRPPKQ
jgi:hypothetical protein